MKGTILLSIVKGFNLRYRAKTFAEDSAFVSIEDTNHPLARHDPRQTPRFIELDRIASSFVESLPPQFKRPINGNEVDSHLYSTFFMSQLWVLLASKKDVINIQLLVLS